MTKNQLNIIRIAVASYEMINGTLHFVMHNNQYLFSWLVALLLYGVASLPDYYSKDDLTQ